MAIVGLLPEAEEELEALPLAEEMALRAVMAKLETLGSMLPFPQPERSPGCHGPGAPTALRTQSPACVLPA
jgi:hypothetical protein